MVSSNGTTRPSLAAVISTPYTYVITIVLLFLAVAGAFAFKIVPAFVGYTGIAAGILSLVAFLAQDLQAESTPAGWPSWTTFAVIVVVGGLEAGIGAATSTTFLTIAGTVGLAVFISQWVINALNQDMGANIPGATEMQIVALLGILVTALVSLSGGTVATFSVNATNAATGGLVTTFAATGGYIFSKEKTSIRLRAYRAAHPGPQ